MSGRSKVLKISKVSYERLFRIFDSHIQGLMKSIGFSESEWSATYTRDEMMGETDQGERGPHQRLLGRKWTLKSSSDELFLEASANASYRFMGECAGSQASISIWMKGKAIASLLGSSSGTVIDELSIYQAADCPKEKYEALSAFADEVLAISKKLENTF